ncbi:helix-turn-helix domain-containing protein [Marinomonas sp. C1424]|uniref:Helix-turn-helix domain-containing protein n=2 Tax=Marinomonas transparens TaxID=2795388 RepID=A0A934MXA2_9GAMM|nr:helix-turn-helix domain-containing protein [Marinomonas transparens]
MTIADRIKQKRIEQELTQAKLAKLVGISQQALQKIEDGSTQKPRDLVEIASALKCTAEWLKSGVLSEIREPALLYNNQQKSTSSSSFIHKAPIISYLQAMQWAEGKSPITKDIIWEETPSIVGENAFWLRVVGDSMTSASGLSIPEGYLILVEPSLSADNGDLVIAKLETGNEVTFKKLVIDAGQTYLKSLNSDYRPIEADKNCHIIGVVKEAKMTF